MNLSSASVRRVESTTGHSRPEGETSAATVRTQLGTDGVSTDDDGR
jgi:hypothetical protein